MALKLEQDSRARALIIKVLKIGGIVLLVFLFLLAIAAGFLLKSAPIIFVALAGLAAGLVVGFISGVFAAFYLIVLLDEEKPGWRKS